jgi:bacteriocin-like protein
MKLTELTKSELETVNGGGKLAYWLGYYGTAALHELFGFNHVEDGDYIVKSPY